MNKRLVARPEGVHRVLMHKDLVCLTDNETARKSAPDPDLTANQFSPSTGARPANIPILPLLEGREGKLREMRFWSKIEMRGPDECWDWQASVNHNGYGRFKIASHVTVHANRVAWTLFNHAEPGEMMVLHGCDRPQCCNPHHLRLGTPLDNTNDMAERGRRVVRDQSGSANGAAKIDEQVLITIVQRLQAGWNNKQIAADLPVGHALVSRIRVGAAWIPQAKALGWEPRAQFQRRRAA